MINRVADKETAKGFLRENNNRSGMIGAEVLYRVLKTAVGAVECFLSVTVFAGAIFGLLQGSGLLGSLFSVSLPGLLESVLDSYDPVGALLSVLMSYIPAIAIALTLNALGLNFVKLLSSSFSGVFTAPASIGLKRYYLHIAQNVDDPNRRYERRKAFSIFEGFDNYLNILMATLTRWLHVVLIPAAIWIAGRLLRMLIVSMVGYSGKFMAQLVMTIIMIAASGIVALLLWAKTWAVPWILAETPSISGAEAVRQSAALTDGHFGDIIIFELSFLGWKILSNITFGLVGLFFEEPYRNMTSAVLYRELKGSQIKLAPMDSGVSNERGVSMEDIAQMLNEFGRKVQNNNNAPSVAPAGNPSVAPMLAGVTGMYAGSSFPLKADQVVVLGRDAASAQIVFNQGAEKISRRHCSVMFDSRTQMYIVVDYSSNGTYVKGSRLQANVPVSLARGTEIALGNNSNVVRLV